MLLKMYADDQVNFIWFTDEKLFTVTAPKNPQNDRLYTFLWRRRRKRSLLNVSCALDPRSASPLWCLSVYRSWAAQTSSSSSRALRSTAHTTATCSCQSSYYPWCARYQGNSSSFNKTTPLHTGHATLCDFSSRQRRRSFHQIFGQRTALTLIRLITDPERHPTANLDQSIIDNAIDEWRKRLRACVQANKTLATLRACCRKQYVYLHLTVWQHKRFIFVKYETLFDFSVVICNKFELLNFPR